MSQYFGNFFKCTIYDQLEENFKVKAVTRVVYKSRQPAKWAGFSARFRQLLDLWTVRLVPVTERS